MARTESKAIMDYLPIDSQCREAIMSPVASGTIAMLVRPTRTGGDVKLWTIDLDLENWTRLITGGLEQQIIQLPN